MGKGEVQLVVIEAVCVTLCRRTGAIHHALSLPPVFAWYFWVIRHFGEIQFVGGPDDCLQPEIITRVAGVEPMVSAAGLAASLGLCATITFLVFQHPNDG